VFTVELDATVTPPVAPNTISPADVLPVDKINGSEPFAVVILETEIVLIL
jgi:hypothetical protein